MLLSHGSVISRIIIWVKRRQVDILNNDIIKRECGRERGCVVSRNQYRGAPSAVKSLVYLSTTVSYCVTLVNEDS